MQTREAIAAAVAETKRLKLAVIHSCEVTKYNDTNAKTENRILIITNISVILYTVANKPKISRCFYWVDLVNVEIADEIIGLFFGDGQMRFHSYENAIIISKLGDLIQRVLTPEEAARASIPSLTSKVVPQNAFGYISRLKSLSAYKEFDLSRDLYDKYEKIVCYRFTQTKFSPKIDEKDFEFLFQSLNAVKYLESITFPALSNFDLFNKLNTFDELHFKHLHFDGTKITNNLTKFLENLTSNQIANNLKDIGFSNMKLRERDVTALYDLCTSKNVESISMNGSIKDKLYDYFFKEFLSTEITSHLLMISFNSTYNINIPLLLNKVRDIRCLSLESCELDVDITLQNIAHAGLPNLTMLNLSGNYASSVSQSIDFPETLHTLYVRNVEWGNRCLISFLHSVSTFKWKNNFKLSIRNIIADSSEINALTSFYTSVKSSNISKLDWASNPISSEFIKFLKRSKNLIELDLSLCFSTENCNLFKQFTDFCIDSRLETLILRGDTNYNLGTSIFPLFDAIPDMRNLKYLNISYQAISNEGMKLFSEAVSSNKKIEKISFKGCGFETVDAFQGFLTRMKHRSNPIFIEWPSDEIKRMKDANEIKKSKIKSLKRHILTFAEDNPYFFLDDENENNDNRRNRKSRYSNYSNNDDGDYDDDSYDDRKRKRKESNAKQRRKTSEDFLFNSNPMTKTMEMYLFDVECKFPTYVSSQLAEEWKEKNSSNDKNRRSNYSSDYNSKYSDDDNDDYSDSDDSDDSRRSKKNKKIRRKSRFSSDDDSYSDYDDQSSRRKKQSQRRRRRRSRYDSDDSNESNDSGSDDYRRNRKRNNKFISINTYDQRKSPKKSLRKRALFDFSSNDDFNQRKYSKFKRRKSYVQDRHINLSDDDSDDDSIKNSSKRRNTDYDASRDKRKRSGWEFPRKILPPSDDKKAIAQIKDKFSLQNLMDKIVNQCDD